MVSKMVSGETNIPKGSALNQWIINRGLEVDGPHLFLDWVPRKGETRLSLILASAVNIQPSHFDPKTSMGTGETVQMDGMIRI